MTPTSNSYTQPAETDANGLDVGGEGGDDLEISVDLEPGETLE